MNEFFDKLGAAARRAADTVTTEVNVAAQEQKIKEAYQALGKLYYQAVSNGTEKGGAEFDELCGRIEASLKRIKELKANKSVTETYAQEEDFVSVD